MKTLINTAFYSMYELTNKISKEIKDGGSVKVLEVSDTDLDIIHAQLLKYFKMKVHAKPIYKENKWHRFLYTIRFRTDPPPAFRIGFELSVLIIYS